MTLSVFFLFSFPVQVLWGTGTFLAFFPKSVKVKKYQNTVTTFQTTDDKNSRTCNPKSTSPQKKKKALCPPFNFSTRMLMYVQCNMTMSSFNYVLRHKKYRELQIKVRLARRRKQSDTATSRVTFYLIHSIA